MSSKAWWKTYDFVIISFVWDILTFYCVVCWRKLVPLLAIFMSVSWPCHINPVAWYLIESRSCLTTLINWTLHYGNRNWWALKCMDSQFENLTFPAVARHSCVTAVNLSLAQLVVGCWCKLLFDLFISMHFNTFVNLYDESLWCANVVGSFVLLLSTLNASLSCWK